MRKTKIICTMGPATDNEEVLRQLMLEGMNTARFNFSHATHQAHKKKFDMLVKLREELNLPVATLLDTKGPEIRIKTFANGAITVQTGDTFTFTTNDIVGDETKVSITYPLLAKDISVGARVLVDDGLIGMTVIEVTDTDIICRVLNNGNISNNKGINVPDTPLSMPYISTKDKEDIIFGVETGFDFIATSFSRTAEDVQQVRNLLCEHGGARIKIIAKIENAEGVANIDSITRAADGVMVARGDMGVEIPLEDVPVLQKMIIKKVYNAGKIVVTATQMLESMIKNPRPTRAEAGDIANAVYDGTSAIMLSGETAAGQYPVESLKTMVRVAMRTEQEINYIENFNKFGNVHRADITHAISHATCTTAHDLGASAIVTVTKSGRTARLVSRFRPNCRILGCAMDDLEYRQLGLSWGVIPLRIEEQATTDELFDHAVDVAKKMGLVHTGDLVVITAGVPLGISGTTNMMKVHAVGNILISGRGITKQKVFGNLCVCENMQQALDHFKEGDILVIAETCNELIPILRQASGIITEQAGDASHAATVGMAMNIPVIVGAENATKLLKSNVMVGLDAEQGTVRSGSCLLPD